MYERPYRGLPCFCLPGERKKKADDAIVWLVPGSWQVERQIRAEGIDKVLTEAGFELRQPGCSACLAMNEDKVPAGKYAVSTSNRNFEGRQGPGALLSWPGRWWQAAAVTGKITDPRGVDVVSDAVTRDGLRCGDRGVVDVETVVSPVPRKGFRG